VYWEFGEVGSWERMAVLSDSKMCGDSHERQGYSAPWTIRFERIGLIASPMLEIREKDVQ
jgi:hypothetical protein